MENNASHPKEKSIIPESILDDLASRFIINIPFYERFNFVRICFQIELAHWFYLDFFCTGEEVPQVLVPCGIKQFASHIFNHVPFLSLHLQNFDAILQEWKNYKMSVPTYGAILLSADMKKVLLVQSYWAKNSWSFPKGKVNENEEPIECAVREVLEETGYSIKEYADSNSFIEGVFNYQYTRLYLVCCVPGNTAFVPRTRKEIKDCDWFYVDQLPLHKTDRVAPKNMNPSAFFMIIPFMKKLRKWIDEHSGDKSKQLANVRDENTDSAGAGGSRGGSISPGYNFLNVDNGQGRKRHKSMSDIDGQNADQTASAHEETAADRKSNKNQQQELNQKHGQNQCYQQPLHNYNLVNVKQNHDRKNKSLAIAKNLPSVNETQMLQLPVTNDMKTGRNSPNARKQQLMQQQKSRISNKTFSNKNTNPKGNGPFGAQKPAGMTTVAESMEDSANILNKLFKQLVTSNSHMKNQNSFFNSQHSENIFNPPQISQLIRNQPSINKWRNVRLNYDVIVNESLKKN